MFIPKRRRQNSIGVKYVQGIIKDEHYEQIFETILGLNDEDILKIDEVNTKHFTFKVEQYIYEKNM